MSFTITRRQFGRAPDGGEVDAWILASPEGMQVEILTLGCIVRRLLVPDRNGVLADVVLGYDSLEEYLAGTAYFGAIIGRVAGRLTSGSFWLNGSPYKLAINDGLNHLHGGFRGFDKYLWQATPLFLENAVALELRRTSPNGEEGYPGTLEVCLRYILNATGELLIETEASTDRATPWSMTHHSYFNLSGEGNRSTLDHALQIFADETIATDIHMTLLNRLEPVTQENDFRKARHLHDAIPELFQNHGDLYRLPICRDKSLAAILSHPKSGRLLEVWTDEQYLQLYTGKNIRDVRGKDHHVYSEYSGICLEAEGYPNGVLHPQLGDVVLQPGEVQCRSTAYRFLAGPAIDQDPAYKYHPPMPIRRDRRIRLLGRSVKAIHAQKPLALSFSVPGEAVELCEQAGILLSVNQNMRYDPTVFAVTRMLRDGYFGEPVFATIDMRGIPHWQPWQADTGGATLRIMSVHYLDCIRVWFGDPCGVFYNVRPNPRTTFSHSDGISNTILEYGNGLRCVVVDDIWTGPAREGCSSGSSYFVEDRWSRRPRDWGHWMVPGSLHNRIGDALREKSDNVFRQICPQQSWLSDAFGCTMGQLLVALEQDTVPALSGRDHLQTLAIVEAAIKSAELGRVVSPREVATRKKR